MINYPVDVKSTRWSVWQVSTGTVIKRNVTWPERRGFEIPGLSDDLVPLLQVSTSQPAHDQATEKVVKAAPVVDVDNNTITEAWEIVPLTQAELDQFAANEAEATERAQAKAAYIALKNGTGTAEERLVRVERVLAYMLNRDYAA